MKLRFSALVSAVGYRRSLRRSARIRGASKRNVGTQAKGCGRLQAILEEELAKVGLDRKRADPEVSTHGYVLCAACCCVPRVRACSLR